MTDGSRPPCRVSTLRQEYFDLKSSDDSTIVHGVFVCIESATGDPWSWWIPHIWCPTRKPRLPLPRSPTAPPHVGTGIGGNGIYPRHHL
jgi:hypothetical protein